MVWRMLGGRFFTPNHANVASEDYKVTKEETLTEVQDVYLNSIFPFLLSNNQTEGLTPDTG